MNSIETESSTQGVMTLWLNNPEKSNAITKEMIHEIISALETIKNDESTRALILRGRGENFCAGADINEMRASGQRDFNDNLADSVLLARLFHQLQQLNIPVIAVIQGLFIGGGAGFVCCADIAIGIDNPSNPPRCFFSEVKLGLVPAVISPYVIDAIGLRQTRRYFLSAEVIDTETALNLGLLHQLCPADQIDMQLQLLCAQLLNNSPIAMNACKHLLRDSKYFTNHLAQESACCELIARLRASDQGREGLSAFLEKRNPIW